MKFILILIFIPFVLFGQKQLDFNKLIVETNHYLNQYSQLTPTPFGNKYYSISDFGLSKMEVEEIMSEDYYEGTLTKKKDSIQNFHLISYFQKKIDSRIEQIVKHPDFLEKDITELSKGNNELSIVKSDDNKLFNFSFDEKTGGSYLSKISRMYYFDEQANKIINVTDNPVFAGDGYSEIYTLETDEGIKYVLTGFVRGCSHCFETFVQLLNSNLTEEFNYSVKNRDWNDGVAYDHETKTIYVDYHIDDLTPYCHCRGEINEGQSHHDKFAKNDTRINCKCKFRFNGNNFELVEESRERITDKEKREE